MGQTLSQSFTAVANGAVMTIKAGQRLKYAVSGTWVATIVFQKQTGSGAFETVESFTANGSGTVEPGKQDERYRAICSAFTSGTAVSTVTNLSGVSSNVKGNVRAATIIDGTIATAFASSQVIDGITLATGDRILLKNQTAGAENGIYVVNGTGAPTRADDGLSSDALLNAQIPVDEGTINADLVFKVTNDSAIVIGTTAITFSTLSVDKTREFITPAGFGKIGGTAGFALTADDLPLATVPASQTASTFVLPVTGYSVGDTVTDFSIMGQIESAGGAVTVDVDLRKTTAADADITDASVQTMTQISVTADDTIDESTSKTALVTPEVIADGEMLYMLITVTTAASTDVALQAGKLFVTEADA